MMTQDEEPSINQISFTWPKGFYNDGIKIGLGTVDKKKISGTSFPKFQQRLLGHTRPTSFRPHPLN